METKGSPRHCVVLVPAPMQGHITPMLQLGAILHSRGFNILVAPAEYNSPNPLNHQEFSFLSLPDDVSHYDKSLGNLLGVLTTVNINCKAPMEDYLVQMMENEELNGKIACIIYDAIMYFADAVANHLRLPSIIMRPYNAAYVLAHHVIFRLQADGCLPLAESQMQETAPRLQNFRFKDFPLSLTSGIPEIVLEFLENMTGMIGSSRAIIWNTIDELEQPSLSQLQQHDPVSIFSIGPFHKMAPASQTSLLEEDNSCIAWLDKQAPNSVLYVSFGSLATMDEKEFIEMAWGLLKSDQPFLWVVRPSSVRGSMWIEQLPQGFENMIKERGYIVKWAPQMQILAHSAVGGCWSHCGWNSTLESISEGVPMICRPYFGDQIVNVRYLTHIWKVGLEIEPASGRGAIAKIIRKLMVDNEGKEMRKRALDMKQKLEYCVQKGGPSYKSLNDLTEFISSLSSLEK